MTLQNFEYSLQTSRQPPYPFLCKVFKCYLLLLEKVTIHKNKKEEKKKKRRKYEKKRKEKDKKKEEKKRRRKKKTKIMKVKRRKNMGKVSLHISTHQYRSIPTMYISIFYHSTPSLPINIVPFLPCIYPFFTTPHHFYQILFILFYHHHPHHLGE